MTRVVRFKRRWRTPIIFAVRTIHAKMLAQKFGFRVIAGTFPGRFYFPDPSRDWHVPELAKATGASRSGLQRLFKIYQQESIHEFLQRTRLDRARQLLCDERLAIKEISARLNFSSEFYFRH